jgi:hypothetical protein
MNGIMTRTSWEIRLFKEVRGLWWPWCIAALASLAAMVTEGDLAEAVRVFFLCGSVALFAVLSFGAEFQERTWPLLLSQPLKRSTLWREKFLVVGAGGALVLVLNPGTWVWLHWLTSFADHEYLLLGLFLFAIVTSSGFWTAVTRSMAAGILCGSLTQVVVFGGFILAVRLLYQHSPQLVAIMLGDHKVALYALFGIYGLIFVWLGRGFWSRKWLRLALMTAAVFLLPELADFAPQTQRPLEVLFVLGVICSAGFWTLMARSTIGGVVFAVASQTLTAMVVMFLLGRFVSPELSDVRGPYLPNVLCIGACVYAGVFLWLGLRRFARLEVREPMAGDGPGIPSAIVRGGWVTRWLICRPQGNVANLLRKELRLQKPVFLAAAVFTACWLVGLGLHLLWPQRGYDHFLDLLLFFYIPVALILAGCIGVGEEKGLGISDWHLTLPSTSRRMWLVKVGLASVTGLALGCLLPAGLFWLKALSAAGAAPSAQPMTLMELMEVSAMVLLAWLSILVSFWASTHVATTVRAFVATLIALAAGTGCALFGIWTGATQSSMTNVQTYLLTWLVTHGHWSPDGFFSWTIGRAIPFVACVACGSWVFLMLRQSLSQFRQPAVRPGVLLKRGVVLGALIFLYAFLARDFVAAADNAWERPQAELEQALRELPSKEHSGNASFSELEATGALSASTKAWLRGATITWYPITMPQNQTEAEMAFAMRYGLPKYSVNVLFPDGTVYGFSFR